MSYSHTEGAVRQGIRNHGHPRGLAAPVLAGSLLVLLTLLLLLPGCSAPRRVPEDSSPSPSAAPDLLRQTQDQAARKSTGCLTCHTHIETPTMHVNPAVQLGCVDCHGGAPNVQPPQGE